MSLRRHAGPLAALLCAAALGWALPAPLAAQEAKGDEPQKKEGGSEKPDPKEPRYLSDWARIVLGRCERVALGRVAKVLRMPTGLNIATFELREVLHGPGEKGASVLVLTTEPRFFVQDDELLLFLVPEGSEDGRYTTLDKVDVQAAGGDVQLETVRRFLAMEALQDPAERRATFKALLFENLARDERWCRENAIRELYIFTEREPGAFGADDLKRLREEALARKGEGARTRLEYAAAHLEVIPLLRRAAGSDDAARREGLDALARLLGETGVPAERIRVREDVVFQVYRSTGDGAERARVVEAASSLGRPRLLVGVLKALGDANVHVRVAALQGVQRHAPARSAPLVARLLEDRFPEVRREAALTLAVVGSKADVPALRALAEDESESEEVRRAAREAVAALGD